MPVKLGRALLVFALLVVAVVSWQWIDDREVTQQTESGSIEMAENESDYYLEAFEITNVHNRKSADGSNTGRQLTITGDSLSHHFRDGNSTLDNPLVTLRTEDGDYWLASASKGNVSAEFDVLDLYGAVVLNQYKLQAGSVRSSCKPTDNPAAVTIDTESLTIDTGERIIQTNDLVTVNGNGWKYRASSMRAEVDKGTLSLTSGVEARFANPN